MKKPNIKPGRHNLEIVECRKTETGSIQIKCISEDIKFAPVYRTFHHSGEFDEFCLQLFGKSPNSIMTDHLRALIGVQFVAIIKFGNPGFVNILTKDLKLNFAPESILTLFKKSPDLKSSAVKIKEANLVGQP